MEEAMAVLLSPHLMDSEATSMLAPIVQEVLAREHSEPVAKVFKAHGWDSVGGQFSGAVNRQALLKALMQLTTPRKA